MLRTCCGLLPKEAAVAPYVTPPPESPSQTLQSLFWTLLLPVGQPSPCARRSQPQYFLYFFSGSYWCRAQPHPHFHSSSSMKYVPLKFCVQSPPQLILKISCCTLLERKYFSLSSLWGPFFLPPIWSRCTLLVGSHPEPETLLKWLFFLLLLFGKSYALFHQNVILVIKFRLLNKVCLMKIMEGLKLLAANQMKLEAKLQTSMCSRSHLTTQPQPGEGGRKSVQQRGRPDDLRAFFLSPSPPLFGLLEPAESLCIPPVGDNASGGGERPHCQSARADQKSLHEAASQWFNRIDKSQRLSTPLTKDPDHSAIRGWGEEGCFSLYIFYMWSWI